MSLITQLWSLSTSSFNQYYSTHILDTEPWLTTMNGDFSCQLWLRIITGNLGYGRVLSFGRRFCIGTHGAGPNYKWHMYSDSSNSGVFDTNLSGDSANCLVDEWHHITVTWKDSTGTTSIYTDGVFSNSTAGHTLSPTSGGGGTDYVILGNPPAEDFLSLGMETNPLKVMISEIRVWNKTLSAAEITAQFQGSNLFRIDQSHANLGMAYGDLSSNNYTSIPNPLINFSNSVDTFGYLGANNTDLNDPTGGSSPNPFPFSGSILPLFIGAPTGTPPEVDPDPTTTIIDVFNFLDIERTDGEGFDNIFGFTDSVNSSLNSPTIISDFFSLTDSLGPDRITADFNGTVSCRIRAVTDTNNSIKIQVREGIDSGYTVAVVVMPNSMEPITSATNAANPVSPTYIQNGVVVYSSSATMPAGDISKAKCYVSFKCSPLIGPRSAEETISWNINIDQGGGTWQANTLTLPGGYFDQIKLFGLTGTIIDEGFEWSSSSAGVISGGILAAPKLNKSLGFLAYGNPYYFHNIPNPSLAKPGTEQLKTHRDAANFIANLTGIIVSWAIPDRPLSNFQPQMSQKAIEALSSLATECGGILRWTGGINYIVTYPDISIGTWVVPDCCLLTGLSRICTGDLNTGIYSPGVYAVPQLGQYDAGIISKNFVSPSLAASGAGGSGGGSVASQNLAIIKDRMTSSDPSYFIDLPYDFDTIYIQNVTVTNGNGPFVTTNPKRFWPLQTGFADKYVGMVDIGGTLKPVLHITSDLFPQEGTNADVDDKHWYMKIDITTKPLNGGGSNNNADSESRTLLAYQFVPVCVATIKCAFFGSIPLPGMFASASIGGKTVTGIVENVSFTSPGVLSVRIIQWARLRYYQHLSTSDNLSTIPA